MNTYVRSPCKTPFYTIKVYPEPFRINCLEENNYKCFIAFSFPAHPSLIKFPYHINEPIVIYFMNLCENITRSCAMDDNHVR